MWVIHTKLLRGCKYFWVSILLHVSAGTPPGRNLHDHAPYHVRHDAERPDRDRLAPRPPPARSPGAVRFAAFPDDPSASVGSRFERNPRLERVVTLERLDDRMCVWNRWTQA
jgi:hypothetical protein